MAVKRFDVPDLADEYWAFLCECGADDCQEWVTLTLTEYESLRQADEPILAGGHTLDPAPKARVRPRKLVDDAKALRAEADVQAKWAAPNLRHDQE